MITSDVISLGVHHLYSLRNHTFDVLTLSKPDSIIAAINLTKIISKLSPLIGNLIEFNIVEYLNKHNDYAKWGEWIRQDPGFPDAIFQGKINPVPGFEIKAWFPLATEITARFKDSQTHFKEDQTFVVMLAWLPEHILYGKPKILDILAVSGKSVAKARDDHYHNPPDYLVLEPEDTSSRTRNLQQTNTNGHKFQGTEKDRKEADRIVEQWPDNQKKYSPEPKYQQLNRQLMERFKYRLDTNFAKMDRIEHPEIEDFKERVLNLSIKELTVKEWHEMIFKGSDEQKKAIFSKRLKID